VITAEKVASSFPYFLSTPVLSISSISGDGSMIGGTITQTGVDFDCAAFDCANTAFIWSLATDERIPLGATPITTGGFGAGAFPKRVPALSRDGQSALIVSENGYYESAIYRDGSANLLRDPVPFGEWLLGTDMSSDAQVVVGSIDLEPFVWTEEAGFQSLQGIGPDSRLGPTAVSGDGQVVVLNDQPTGSYFPRTVNTEFRNALAWSLADGPTELIPLFESDFSTVSDVSFDGSVIVGTSRQSDGSPRATAWIDKIPMELEAFQGFEYSLTTGVSADGRTIIGFARDAISTSMLLSTFDPDVDPGNTSSIVWKNGQVYDLQELLTTQYGLAEELDGWQLQMPTAISDDGGTIAGLGIGPNGNSAAWVVLLNVPEPGTEFLFVVALLCQALFARKKHQLVGHCGRTKRCTRILLTARFFKLVSFGYNTRAASGHRMVRKTGDLNRL